MKGRRLNFVPALFGVAWLSLPLPLETPPCTEAVHRQFDFWLGEWEIAQEFPQPDGSVVRLPARSTVTAELEGCALIERWQGQVQYFWEGMEEPEALQALSIRAWDDVDGLWRIYWMDTRSPRRWTDGGFAGQWQGDTGTFFSHPDVETGAPSRRIRFRRLADDQVEWDLSVRRGPEAPWGVLWRMHFTRR